MLHQEVNRIALRQYAAVTSTCLGSTVVIMYMLDRGYESGCATGAVAKSTSRSVTDAWRCRI